MSQTAFGLLIVGSFFAFTTGVTVFADWQNIKRWCVKHRLIRSH